MSAYFHTVPPRSFHITIDTLDFHAQSWCLSAACTHAEQGSVTGSRYMTNSFCKTRTLHLKGSFFFLDDPAEVLIPLDDILYNKVRFAFTLRGIRCFAASLVGYTISEEATRGTLSCELDILISSPLTKVPDETESDTGTETTIQTEAAKIV